MKAFGMGIKEINFIDSKDVIDKNEVPNNSELNILKLNASSRIAELINKYDRIFMSSKFDVGLTNLTMHNIETKGEPILINPRRQPMHLEGKIDELIKNLLLANIIKPCRSPWNSPLVIVGKKDGSLRMCLDFRKLNSVTEKYSFPVPDINMLLDTLSGSMVFSSIDLG